MSSKNTFCSNCGQKLPTGINVKFCPNCGVRVQEENTGISGIASEVTNESKAAPSYQPSVVAQLPYKSPGTAALIAFIGGLFGLPGIGHIYVGMLGRGIQILILGLVLYAITVLLIFFAPPVSVFFGGGYFIVFVWQIFDARNQAREFNESVKRTGKEPW